MHTRWIRSGKDLTILVCSSSLSLLRFLSNDFFVSAFIALLLFKFILCCFQLAFYCRFFWNSLTRVCSLGYFSKSSHLLSFHLACSLSSTGFSYPKLFSIQEQFNLFSLGFPFEWPINPSFPWAWISKQLQRFASSSLNQFFFFFAKLECPRLIAIGWVV